MPFESTCSTLMKTILRVCLLSPLFFFQTRETIPEMSEVWNESDTEDEDEDEEDEGVDENVDETSDTNATPSKRRRTESGRMSPRARREKREQRMLREKAYYRASSFGQATSVLMWQLASDLGKSDNHLLWLSIVGLTDQFIEDRVDSSSYTLGVQRLSDDVRRLNTIDDEADGDSMDRIKIKPELELRLMLLRQWTVYDAIVHSRYMATRLGVWRQLGKQKVKNLLAKMGIPMEQCKQKYTSMDFNLRKQLFDKLQDTAQQDFKLDQCVFPSFVSQASFRHQYSASDVVYSVGGLLEAVDTAAEGEPSAWRKNFFEAFDALSMKNAKLMRRGMDQCQRQHKAVLKQVESIVDGNNALKKSGGFRWTTIKDQPDQEFFTHFPTLRKLGLYLIDTHRFNTDHGKKRKALPLVIAALNPVSETYMVCGMWNTANVDEGSVIGNEFGNYFEAAAEKTGSRASLIEFDSSVMEIKSDDFHKFIMELSSKLKGQGKRLR